MPDNTIKKFDRVLICIVSENNDFVEKLQNQLCEWNFFRVIDPKTIRSTKEAIDWLDRICKQTESIAVDVNHLVCRCLHVEEVACIANSINDHSFKVIPAVFLDELSSTETIQLQRESTKENLWKVVSRARMYTN